MAFSSRDVPGWPQAPIPREEKREVYTFPWSFFPQSLHEDAQGYLRRLEGVDLSQDGPPKPARPATIATRERQLRMAASALIHKGVPKEDLISLRSMLTFERFQLILRYFLDRNGGKPSPQLGYMASFLKTVAKYWLKLDEKALQPFDKLSRRLNQSNRGRGLTPKNRARLRPFDDPHMVQRFLELPFKIREDVEKDKKSPIKRRALLARKAAAIAILQIMPIRRRNISMTDMEQNLINRGKRLYLVFEGDETKNEEPVDLEFPSETKDLIAWYVRE